VDPSRLIEEHDRPAANVLVGSIPMRIFFGGLNSHLQSLQCQRQRFAPTSVGSNPTGRGVRYSRTSLFFSFSSFDSMIGSEYSSRVLLFAIIKRILRLAFVFFCDFFFGDVEIGLG